MVELLNSQPDGPSAIRDRAHDAIHVCLAFDLKYIQHAAVTIRSAAQSLAVDKRIVFHILHSDEIPLAEQDKLQSVAPSATLCWHAVEIERYSHLPDNRDHLSIATYLRLFIPDVLNDVTSRVLYLDSDIIVQRSLGDLWRIDLGGCPIAAAPDEGGLTQARRLNMPDNAFYFNAGVLIFDLTAVRSNTLLKAATELANDPSVQLELQDQDILNLLFVGKVARMDLCWNANTRLFTPNPFEPAYTADEAHAAARSPGILHFTDSRKPWNSNCNHPKRAAYWAIRNQTPWRERGLQGFRRRIKDALRNTFSKSRRAARSSD